ncbi:DUF2892 domain-containing protein [Polaromonas sp. P2-4]|nr:DUF2892 domain-containing protein [Polaromonas sp. P2-4]
MFYLQRNLPAWERALRLGGGLVLAFVSVLWLPGGWLAWTGLASALMMGLTGIVGFCPACALAGRQPVRNTKS